MKLLRPQSPDLLRTRASHAGIISLCKFLAGVATLILLYTLLFQHMMSLEGQSHGWVTGLYWTLTVMSTLGFGDITFQSDAGRIFSLIVLLSGMILLLVLLPFTFIRLFYEPWMASHRAARAPRVLPEYIRDHVILTRDESITRSLIPRLISFQYPYVLVVPELEEALRLREEGLSVGLGPLDDPDTYKNLRASSAALIATTNSDVINTNVVFNARGINENAPILATADHIDSVDVLELAGADEVLQVADTLGQWLANRFVGGDSVSHPIGKSDDLLFAQAAADRTPLVGKTLRENAIRERFSVVVVGLWNGNILQPAEAESVVTENTVLILAGTREQLNRYDEAFVIYNVTNKPVLVIGAGRVGRAVCRELDSRELDYRVVEKNAALIMDSAHDVLGSAADLEILKRAKIMEAPAVIISTGDDDLNVYLTIYIRRLRPDIQIISRATAERTVSTLRRAGADFGLSYGSVGATMIMNRLRRGNIVMLTEEMGLFRVRTPNTLTNKALQSSRIRQDSGCSVVAVKSSFGTELNPRHDYVLPSDSELILFGSSDGEEAFLKQFVRG